MVRQRHQGLEQGFTLTAPPVEAGDAGRVPGTRAVESDEETLPAYVVLKLTGHLRASISPDGQAIDFGRPSGGINVLHYGALEVRDSTGRRLRSWMEGFAEAGIRGIRLVYDDTEAIYPVTIDPLTASAAWTGEGNQDGAKFGEAVTAGDINGDDFDDVIVGAPEYGDHGAVFVYYGSASGLVTDAQCTNDPDRCPLVLEGTSDHYGFGRAVASGEVWGGDGFDDIIVDGNPYVLVYRGSGQGVVTADPWSVGVFAGSDVFGGDGRRQRRSVR